MQAAAAPSTVPRGALIGAGALIAFAIVAALVGRVTGLGTLADRPSPVAESRDVRFEDIDAGPPFRLSRLVDGGTVIEDLGTHRRIELDAFGRPNAGAFSAILAAATRTE